MQTLILMRLWYPYGLGLTGKKLDRLTPAGKVPTLKHNDDYIWDSLAICEYMNDLYPEKLFLAKGY